MLSSDMETMFDFKGKTAGQARIHEQIEKLKKDVVEGMRGNAAINFFHKYLLTTANPMTPVDSLLVKKYESTK